MTGMNGGVRSLILVAVQSIKPIVRVNEENAQSFGNNISCRLVMCLIPVIFDIGAVSINVKDCRNVTWLGVQGMNKYLARSVVINKITGKGNSSAYA